MSAVFSEVCYHHQLVHLYVTNSSLDLQEMGTKIFQTEEGLIICWRNEKNTFWEIRQLFGATEDQVNFFKYIHVKSDFEKILAPQKLLTAN